MAKHTPKNEDEKGIYLQKRIYWWRFSHGGKQHFMSLSTPNKDEAIAKKKYYLATGLHLTGKVGAKVWPKAIDDYLAEKVAKGEIRKSGEGRVKSAINVFVRACGKPAPSDVTLEDLQDYYIKRRKTSEAGARSSVNTVQAFFNHLGLLQRRVEFVANSRPESRQEIATMAQMNSWIEECEEENLKFVLFCLANCGMRAGEVKHACAEWFSNGLVNIPSKQVYKMKDGSAYEWRTKDNDPRQIPIPPKMREFLDAFLKGKKGLVNKSAISKDFIWDFRKPLAEHMKKVGRPDFFPHAFRHSWITAMMNQKKSIQQVSSWSGDSLQTLEKNYWKKQVVAGETDDVVEGIKEKSMAEIIQEAVSQAVKQTVAELGVKAQQKEKENSLKDALKGVIKKISTPDFLEELAEKYSTESVMDTMTDEQREEFLESLPD